MRKGGGNGIAFSTTRLSILAKHENLPYPRHFASVIQPQVPLVSGQIENLAVFHDSVVSQ